MNDRGTKVKGAGKYIIIMPTLDELKSILKGKQLTLTELTLEWIDNYAPDRSIYFSTKPGRTAAFNNLRTVISNHFVGEKNRKIFVRIPLSAEKNRGKGKWGKYALVDGVKVE